MASAGKRDLVLSAGRPWPIVITLVLSTLYVPWLSGQVHADSLYHAPETQLGIWISPVLQQPLRFDHSAQRLLKSGPATGVTLGVTAYRLLSERVGIHVRFGYGQIRMNLNHDIFTQIPGTSVTNDRLNHTGGLSWYWYAPLSVRYAGKAGRSFRPIYRIGLGLNGRLDYRYSIFSVGESVITDSGQVYRFFDLNGQFTHRFYLSAFAGIGFEIPHARENTISAELVVSYSPTVVARGGYRFDYLANNAQSYGTFRLRPGYIGVELAYNFTVTRRLFSGESDRDWARALEMRPVSPPEDAHKKSLIGGSAGLGITHGKRTIHQNGTVLVVRDGRCARLQLDAQAYLRDRWTASSSLAWSPGYVILEIHSPFGTSTVPMQAGLRQTSLASWLNRHFYMDHQRRSAFATSVGLAGTLSTSHQWSFTSYSWDHIDSNSAIVSQVWNQQAGLGAAVSFRLLFIRTTIAANQFSISLEARHILTGTTRLPFRTWDGLGARAFDLDGPNAADLIEQLADIPPTESSHAQGARTSLVAAVGYMFPLKQKHPVR